MSTPSSASTLTSPLRFLSATLLLLAIVLPADCAGHHASGKKVAPSQQTKPSFKPGPWKQAHATFYEGNTASYGGACGYKDVAQLGYGLDTVALSNVLFNEGKACGACYEIKCVNSPQWCNPGAKSIFVTATDNCPPNYQQGGWCNPPREHFDLAKPAYLQFAVYKGGIVPVQYRRVQCKKQGGIKFTITGNMYYNVVAVWNVGGAGDVVSVQVKDNDMLPWTRLTRTFGHEWQTSAKLAGESLSFRVQTSDGRFSTSWSLTPKNWQFGQTFEGKNFH